MYVRRDYSVWHSRLECGRAFLPWQQCSESKIAYDVALAREVGEELLGDMTLVGSLLQVVQAGLAAIWYAG